MYPSNVLSSPHGGRRKARTPEEGILGNRAKQERIMLWSLLRQTSCELLHSVVLRYSRTLTGQIHLNPMNLEMAWVGSVDSCDRFQGYSEM
jgi:hypothetical protein